MTGLGCPLHRPFRGDEYGSLIVEKIDNWGNKVRASDNLNPIA